MVQQEDLLDLITALLNLIVFLAIQSQRFAHSKAILDDLSISVDTTSLDQHKLCYCTNSRGRYEISDDVIAKLRRPKGPPSGAPYLHRKEKETHE